MGKVETIFDYNPTERELRRWGVDKNDGYGHYEERFALFKKIVTTSKETDYYMLGLLFSMRGDRKRAAEYFAKAPSWQQDLLIQDF
ncbi:MAG: hypothetical protein LBS43_02250 [Prevotellaceae bacterium]|jgi:hypothetical protein|nr:hypothetical protein [Prevotellaceae bacterium]